MSSDTEAVCDKKDDILSPIESNDHTKSINELTIQLLALINQYEDVSNGAFRTNFIEGFMNLSRANFNSTSLRTFGIESIDLRLSKACKVVDTREEFQLVDLLAEQQAREKDAKERQVSKQKEDTEKNNPGKNNSDKNNSDKSNSDSINHKERIESDKKTKLLRRNPKKEDVPTAISSGIKNMSINETKEIDLESEFESKLKDPIYQFGGLVPYQLRECQNSFNKSLYNCVEMIALQTKMKTVIEQIEKLQED